MTESTDEQVAEPEITALGRVYSALKGLDEDAQRRVLAYVATRLNLAPPQGAAPSQLAEPAPARRTSTQQETDVEDAGDERESAEDDLEGVSLVGKKWIRRNDLDSTQLSKIFSLGVADIDLVAKKAPGRNKKERMRSVFLLKGLAAYLGTGTARFKDDEAREACSHYGAHDPTNFAAYLRSFSPIVSGSKTAGYTLTARGLAEGTDLVKEMLQAGADKDS